MIAALSVLGTGMQAVENLVSVSALYRVRSALAEARRSDAIHRTNERAERERTRRVSLLRRLGLALTATAPRAAQLEADLVWLVQSRCSEFSPSSPLLTGLSVFRDEVVGYMRRASSWILLLIASELALLEALESLLDVGVAILTLVAVAAWVSAREWSVAQGYVLRLGELCPGVGDVSLGRRPVLIAVQHACTSWRRRGSSNSRP